MATIFSSKIAVAVLSNSEKLTNKIKTLFVQKDDQFNVFYFQDVDELKNHVEQNNVNIAFCDIDPFNKDQKFSQKLARELMDFKRGTYLIVLTDDKQLVNITTLYRIGTAGLLFKEDSINEYKKELERAVSHIHCWKSRFEQVLTDKSMEREFDDLFK